MTCVNGDLEAVREQLDKGANITWRSPHRGMVSTGHYLREQSWNITRKFVRYLKRIQQESIA